MRLNVLPPSRVPRWPFDRCAPSFEATPRSADHAIAPSESLARSAPRRRERPLLLSEVEERCGCDGANLVTRRAFGRRANVVAELVEAVATREDRGGTYGDLVVERSRPRARFEHRQRRLDRSFAEAEEERRIAIGARPMREARDDLARRPALRRRAARIERPADERPRPARALRTARRLLQRFIEGSPVARLMRDLAHDEPTPEVPLGALQHAKRLRDRCARCASNERTIARLDRFLGRHAPREREEKLDAERDAAGLFDLRRERRETCPRVLATQHARDLRAKADLRLRERRRTREQCADRIVVREAGDRERREAARIFGAERHFQNRRESLVACVGERAKARAIELAIDVTAFHEDARGIGERTANTVREGCERTRDGRDPRFVRELGTRRPGCADGGLGTKDSVDLPREPSLAAIEHLSFPPLCHTSWAAWQRAPLHTPRERAESCRPRVAFVRRYQTAV